MKKAQLAQRKYLAIAVAAASFAQLHSVSAGAEEKSYQLEQVIVTSQKSDDRVQDIPATVNVVTGETLDKFEITKFSDLSQVTAGLSLDVLTSRRQSVNMRGVETNPDAGVADGVAVYWNDLNVRTDVAFQQLFDVESIEVLRGPQGTLQGATSPAGAIHLHTRMPYLQDFSGDVSQTFSDNNGSNTEFGMDIPIIPGQLAVRVAGVYDAADVNDTKNITTGRDDTSLSKAGRFSAVFQPGDIFTAKLAYEHLEKSADADVILSGHQTGKRDLSPYDRYALASLNNVTNNRNNIASLNLSWDLGKNQVVWETGYYNSNQVAYLDSDLANSNNNFTLNIIPQKAERLVQEARLTTEISPVWTSLVGLYYQKDSSIASPVVNNTNAALGGNFHTDLDIASHGETYALFTHQKFEVLDDGLLEFGLRYQALHQFNATDGGII
ncbi:MAG TPA: TonB-dependent receptor plug domain-containing protein, partial [Spongiibacteraceae bacterium]|nr:TonB-dependent receptor plug domain-containing protein [Spongiibacteraceae bacterium]